MARRIEWPTVAVAAGVYGAWAGLLAATPWTGATAAALLMIPVLVLHSSLQHEIMHGHPFGDRRLNDLLGTPGLGLYLPYGRFADTHLAHHDTPDLTEPLADPESYYVRPEDWQRYGPVRRGILQVNRCLAGRMLIAPLFFTLGLLRHDLRAIARGDRRILRAWLAHLATVPAVLALVVLVGGIPLWLYALACYAALSVLSIRTFLEHRAVAPFRERSVIIERGGLLGFLFLNNHLHALHHAQPEVAWYRLPALYRRERDRVLNDNGGYAYPSYGAVIRRYLLAPKEPAVHPGAMPETPSAPSG
ncbi:MAG: fatty acid desaturase [Rhodospirillaceae bacterium]|nr:fatty acid desaturase [Rhodospirillaceae bacterium]